MKLFNPNLKLILAIGLSLPVIAGVSAHNFVQASDDTKFSEYRDSLADGNPGEFWVDDGEELFFQKNGPKNASLEKCDFGLGPGVLEGAYAQLPRYFADTDKVETLESRLMTCMKTLQGLNDQDIEDHYLQIHYLNAAEEDSRVSPLSQLATFVASKSNGLKFQISLEHPKEKHSYELGKKTFWHRMGSMDLSCAHCHAAPGRILRGVELPIMTNPERAGKVMGAFPAYVNKDGNVRTQWWRNQRCILAMRLPWLKTGSEIDAALILYQVKKASQSEEKISVPGIKPRA
ncbi:sulfur oxidation c-type cytochrome SoxA [Thiomicrorhabdus indica]|uniref:sulfur oxidation c-type cytochrome SoxA n=1 Tax=Thiomicrorhabdus indica TaxID=2267253 RepID=UPI00102DEAE8|nr:sulfur oxidation c-type cytochrome SoxA [Thiomicrorhabdus indica]